MVEAATGEALHFHSCRAWLKEWLAGKRGAVAARSLEKYEQVLNDFLAHLAERADLPLAGISLKDVRAFRDRIAAKGCTPGTINQNVRQVLSAPFAAAVRLGYIPLNPCAAVEALKDDVDAQRGIFSAAQVGAIVEAAEGDWKGAVLCGYFTGLRLRDIANLRWESVDLDARLLRLKTGKRGVVGHRPFARRIRRAVALPSTWHRQGSDFPDAHGQGDGRALWVERKIHGDHGAGWRPRPVAPRGKSKSRSASGDSAGCERGRRPLHRNSSRRRFRG